MNQPNLNRVIVDREEAVSDIVLVKSSRMLSENMQVMP